MNPLSTHLYPFFGSVIQSFETRRVNFNRINCRNNRQDRRDITQIWGLHPGLTKMANFPSLSCGSALAAVLRAWLFCFPFHWPALARGCDGLDTEPETYSCHRLRDFSHLTYRNESTNRISFHALKPIGQSPGIKTWSETARSTYEGKVTSEAIVSARRKPSRDLDFDLR